MVIHRLFDYLNYLNYSTIQLVLSFCLVFLGKDNQRYQITGGPRNAFWLHDSRTRKNQGPLQLWLVQQNSQSPNSDFAELPIIHGSLNVPIEHHPTIRYMVYKCLFHGYYKVMSNIPKMGHLPTPVIIRLQWGNPYMGLSENVGLIFPMK